MTRIEFILETNKYLRYNLLSPTFKDCQLRKCLFMTCYKITLNCRLHLNTFMVHVTSLTQQFKDTTREYSHQQQQMCTATSILFIGKIFHFHVAENLAANI